MSSKKPKDWSSRVESDRQSTSSKQGSVPQFFHKRGFFARPTQPPSVTIATVLDIDELVRQAYQVMQDIMMDLEKGMLLDDNKKAFETIEIHLTQAHEFLTSIGSTHDDYQRIHLQLVALRNDRDELQQILSPEPGVSRVR